MSELRLTTLTLPTAPVGPVNPLPPLFGGADLHQVEDTSQADEEMRHNIAYGRVPSVMPYLMQDGYTRERAPAEHPVAVLENATLRATFLLGAAWPPVVAGPQADRARTPLPQPGVPARQPRPARRLAGRMASSGTSPPSATPPPPANPCTPPGSPAPTAPRYCACGNTNASAA